MISPGRGLRRASAADMARRPDAIGWKLRAELTNNGHPHEIETWADQGPRSVKIDGKAASQVDLGRLVRVLWLVPSMDRLWTETAEGRRRFLDRVALSFDPTHAESALSYEKAMRERNRLLKDQVRDGAWYSALETQMATMGHRIETGRQSALDLLETAQQHANTEFPLAQLTLLPGEGGWHGGIQGLAQALAHGRRRDMAAGRTLTGPHRADLGATYAAKNVPARDCSTGEQKALLISLILANARALAKQLGHAPVLLLDEVAAHLDADRRAALYDEVTALGAQAFMTGTGPELFADLGARAQLLEVTETSGQSVVRSIA
jgi:DNA replication and repair protein RecF